MDSLLTADLRARVAKALDERRYSLGPAETAIRMSMVGELDAMSPGRHILDAAFKSTVFCWWDGLDGFWASIPAPSSAGLTPAGLRGVVNRPDSVPQTALSRTCASYVDGTRGRVDPASVMKLRGLRGEDGTTYFDDLVVFCLNGFESDASLDSLRSGLKSGSTVTSFFPLSHHKEFVSLFGLVPVDPLLDRLSAAGATIKRVYEKKHPEYAIQIFGID